jgi:hypothetical protein
MQSKPRLCELIPYEWSAPKARVQPDAASGEQIVAILRVGFVPNVISIDHGSAADAQAVRRLIYALPEYETWPLCT